MKKITFQKNTTLFVVFIFLLSVVNSFAQKKAKFNYATAAKKEKANYFSIVAQKKQELKSYDLSNINDLKEYKHFNRWKEYWRIRVNADGTFPNENTAFFSAAILTKDGKIKTSKYAAKSTAEPWNNIGTNDVPDSNGYPNFPQMGRLTSFLRIRHATDPTKDVLFVGAPNGGVWKSTDGGATWTPKLDMIAGIGVTDIKTASTTNINNYTTKPIYISTGDWDGDHVKSIGVLKSTDGGETFASTDLTYTLENQKLLGDLVVVDDNTVFVGTATGISKTTDGGSSWNQVFDAQGGNANMGRVAVSGTKIMYTGYFDTAYTADYTDDNNWNFVDGSTGNFDKKAVTVGEDGEFYIQDMSGQIMQYDGATNKFTNVGTIPAEYNSQQGYNQALIVRNNFVLSGEFNAGHSSDNGANWYRSLNGYWTNSSDDGNYIHSDHHRLGKLEEGSLKFWSANDGGLNYITYSSNTDQKPTIEYKTAKTIVTQHFSVAINPATNGDDYVTGNQDNDGFSKIGGTWYAVALGDGIESAINYNNPSIRYATNQNGLLVRSDAGFKNELNGDYTLSPAGISFNHYMELDRTNPTILYMNADKGGKDKDDNPNPTGIFKITDNGTELTSTMLDAGNPAHKFNTHAALILAINDNNIIRKIPTDGSTPTSLTGAQNLGTGVNIESIDFNASNPNTMYVTTKGYVDGKKVYKSTDGGANFTNISNNLPNVIINKILLKQGETNETLFVATNIGVYVTTNGGTSWDKLGAGLPNVDVKDIEINYSSDRLVAATFGRGLWDVNVANSTLSLENNSIDTSLEFSVYPNPVQNSNLKIAIKEGLQPLKFEIYNVVGGIVKKGTVSNNKEINVDQLANNVYLIRLYNAEFNAIKKFVLAK
ncbi:T9SS type A sorting domain-containing protein [Polaribacter haliotis]|uniref:T9SS type A sorting domain-containing protein n=1 Tax=Polaribacter haliotis TaxID=1888915 RepID=A0A7L8ABN6_9FLAO|nr:T9SS type A sorting domain-containing protein [Polaribacter haliotis]QOD59392.1 T9SS type A sorting domain-containing protein [Polaribacter haliotis]